MKSYISRMATVALAFGMSLSLAPASYAQATAAAGKAQKFQALAKQLNLTPEQEKQLMPILQADAPKLEAIKNNTSLGPLQKMQQLKAIHEQSDPQVKAILNPQQYEQLQQIRQQEIHEAMEKKMGQQ
jgi:Spy/CpxP family protein refolding chaperone